MVAKGRPHPAVEHVLAGSGDVQPSGQTARIGKDNTTSLSLARALAIGCLSRLDPAEESINVWDPAAGTGLAGSLLVAALRSAGVRTRYRGQDIDHAAVNQCRHRFADVPDAEIAQADTLAHDAYEGFDAALVLVDAPLGVAWAHRAPDIEARQRDGAFRFGLPQRSDVTWLFISLALEKLRPADRGGGRAAALVTPRELSVGGATGVVRRRIVDSGLLESVTRLPDGLAPNTMIPLYLLTFSNAAGDARPSLALIADLQTMFTTSRGSRSIPVEAFRELEGGLRTKKAGPRNRTVGTHQFIRRDAKLSRTTRGGRRLAWPVTTYNDTAVDAVFLQDRYGPDTDIAVEDPPRETVDLDPSPIFRDDSRQLLLAMESNAWPSRRLSALLAVEPEALTNIAKSQEQPQLFVPTTRAGRASVDPSDTDSDGRVLAIRVDDDAVHPPFLAAWLNSEQGVASRHRAIDSSSTGHQLRALRSDSRSLMRWADELLVPVPDLGVQLDLASADERLSSFQAALSTQRASIWSTPENADHVVSKVASAFDDSLTSWLDELPYPIALSLWTAEAATSASEQQRAYIHAWEAIVTFHATVLLSACRNAPGGGDEIEAAIRRTLHENRLGIERASFGTWVVIAECIAKNLRAALESGDADDVARIRRAFGDLGRTGIERLVSKDLVKKFSEVNSKRNRWLGHTGYTSEQEWRTQVDTLVADLRELRSILGDVWSQLLLVRPGTAKRGRAGIVQRAEVAVGTRTPFATREFAVGDHMYDGELYLVRDGSQSPLRLGHFVQLREAPSSAQFTTYFYNRTEGSSVRMVSYQYGPDSELHDDLESFRTEFGKLASA